MRARCVKIEDSAFITKNREVSFLSNVFGEVGLFLLSKERTY